MSNLIFKEKCLTLLITDLLKDLHVWYPNHTKIGDFYYKIKNFPTLISQNIFEKCKILIKYTVQIKERNESFFLKEIKEIDLELFQEINKIFIDPSTTLQIKEKIWDYVDKFLYIVSV